MKGTITITVTDEEKTVTADLILDESWSDRQNIKGLLESVLDHEIKGGEA